MIPRWFLWTLLALVSWGIWAILSKLIGDALSPVHSQAISVIGILPIVAAITFLPDTPRGPGARRGIGWAIAAGMCSCVGNLPYYGLLGSGADVTTIVPLTSLYPLVTILLAIPLLGERLNPLQLLGIVVSLVAMYYLSDEGKAQGGVSAWLYSMIPVSLWGTAGFLQKLSTNYLSGRRSAIWFLVSFVVVALLFLLPHPLPEQVSFRSAALSVAIGFALALGNYAILAAFACGGKAAVITPLTALYLVVSIPIAVVFLDEGFGRGKQIGAAAALLAVLLLSLESSPAPSPAVEVETEPST